MKREIGFIFTILLLFSAMSCSDKKTTQDNTATAFQIDSVDVHGIQRMQVSKSEQKVKMNGKDYVVRISRVPADSLPLVKNEQGDIYVDNKITLNITRDKGERVFNKVFTKQSFADLVGTGFLSKSILEGMVFDKVASAGFVFAASVSFPQTDLYVPISVVISPSGNISLSKDELMDDTYIGEENN